MLYILLILFVLIALLSIRFNENILPPNLSLNDASLCESIPSPFLNKDFTNKLRGFSIIAIMFSHFINMIYFSNVSSLSIVKWFFSILAASGVAIFLFLSGYGNYLAAKNEYTFSRLYKQSLRLYISTGIVILTEFLFALIIGIKNLFPTLKSLFYNLITLTEPPFSSWYLKEQLFLYILIFLCFKLSKKYNILLMFIFSILFVLFAIKFNLKGFWWVYVISFPLGTLVAAKKSIFSSISKLKTYFYLFLSVLFLIISVILFLTLHNEIFYISLSLSTSFLIALLSLIINIKSNIFDFCGKYSLEIYLLHLFSIALLAQISFLNSYSLWIKFLIMLLVVILFSKPLNIFSAIISKKLS